MNIPCEIVEDLLPLYTDNVCTEQSRQAVAEHLNGCKKCRKLIKSIELLTVPQIEPDHPVSDKAIKKGLRKIRHHWWASILVILALIPVAFLGWNEFSAQGVAFTNLDELYISNAFMDCLVEADYAGAFSYINIADKKHAWLQEWFEEEDLMNMEADALAKFCALGEEVEALGGIDGYEYVGTSASYGVSYDGTKVHQVYYRIRFNGGEQRFTVDVSSRGIDSFGGFGSFLTDPIAKLGAWGEYLWQDYKGCYFDPELKDYVYYNK